MFGYFLYRNAWRFDDAPHKEEKIPNSIVRKLLNKKGWLLRNTFDFDREEETEFWYIIKDRFDDFNELSYKTRKRVRKALNHYEYKIIDKEILVREGYDIYKESLNSYRIKDRKVTRKEFLKLFKEGSECWACYEKRDNQLIGFAVNYIWEDSCQYEFSAIIPKYRKDNTNPYYGLYHKRNQYYLGEKKLKYVCDGSRSITEHSNIQPFLIHNFKFRKAYCKLKVHYKWWFGVVVKLLFPFRNIIPFRNVKAILRLEEYSRKSK